MDPPLKLFGQMIAFSSSLDVVDVSIPTPTTDASSALKDVKEFVGSESNEHIGIGVEGGFEVGDDHVDSVSDLATDDSFDVEAGSQGTVVGCPVGGSSSTSKSGCSSWSKSGGLHGTPKDKSVFVEKQALGMDVGMRSPSSPLSGRRRSAGDDLGTSAMSSERKRRPGREELAEEVPKALPKPVGPVTCPRCHSLDTKFCYFNNYNINQPRHFCKSCQRYWTSGGTLRNVPVGAGRRKNKHGGAIVSRGQSSSEATPVMVRRDAPEIASPLVVGKSMASLNNMRALEALILANPATPPATAAPPAAGLDRGKLPALSETDLDDSPCSSLNGAGDGATTASDAVGWTPPPPTPGAGPSAYGPYYHGGNNFPYGYNLTYGPPPPPAWNGGVWGMPPWVSPGLSFGPGGWAPWGAMPWPLAGAVPPLPPAAVVPSTSTLVATPLTPTAKQPRSSDAGDRVEGRVWAPKSLRMADPEEAVQSSLFRSLGVGARPESSGSMFKAFQPRLRKQHTDQDDLENGGPLHTNPAAMTRSMNFHESN